MRDFRAACADESGHADDLAGVERERHVREHAFQAQPVDAQDLPAGRFRLAFGE